MTPEDALKEAYEHYGAGRLDRVEALCRGILGAQPEHAEALHLLGVVAMRVGKHDLAIQFIEKAIAGDSQQASYHANVGEAYRQTGDSDRAEAHFVRALEIDPNLAGAHSNLGAVRMARGATDDAIAAFDSAIRLDPTLVAARTNLGNALAQQGRLDEAKRGYEQALEIDPANATSHHRLGAIATLQGRFDDAAAALRRAHELDPMDVTVCHDLGCVLQLKGDPANALPYHRRAAEQSPAVAVAHMGLSSVLARVGQAPEANEAAHRAVRLKRTFEVPCESDRPVGRVVFLQGVENDFFSYGPEVGRWLVRGHNNLDARLDPRRFSSCAFLMDGIEPGRELDALPACDVIFNAVSDPDSKPASLDLAARIAAAVSVPVLNAPDAIGRSRRDANFEAMRDLDGIVFPKTIRIEGPFESEAAVTDLLNGAGIGFPVLARPAGSHRGQGLVKADDVDALTAYLREGGARPFYLTEFVDYALDSGEFIKMRVQVVDGEIYPNQAYISPDWNVGGFRKVGAFMQANPWTIEESRRFCEDPRAYLGADAFAALAAIKDVLKLDYFGIDFSRLRDGRLIVFEANASMQIPDPGTQKIEHRRPCIDAIIDAMNRMFERRIAGA